MAAIWCHFRCAKTWKHCSSKQVEEADQKVAEVKKRVSWPFAQFCRLEGSVLEVTKSAETEYSSNMSRNCHTLFKHNRKLVFYKWGLDDQHFLKKTFLNHPVSTLIFQDWQLRDRIESLPLSYSGTITILWWSLGSKEHYKCTNLLVPWRICFFGFC